MRIDINQHKISLGDKYRVFIDGQPAYTAASELFRILPVINLFKNDDPVARLTIRKRWSFFIPKYDIVMNGGLLMEFRAFSFWKLHYQCACNPDIYNIYGHRGRKHSIYRNGTQVAWWDKEAVSWFDGDNYSINADNDSNAELIIAFCLVLDNYKSDRHDGNAISFDIGNIFGQVKEFDPYWKPRHS